MKTTLNSELNSEIHTFILLALYTCKTNTPKSHSELDMYIKSTDKWQISNQEDVIPDTPVYVRLGWSSTDSDNWRAKRQEWDELYRKYINVDLCTKTVRDAKTKFIEDFHAFARPFLYKIKSSETALPKDGDIFHVALKNKKASHTRSQLSYKIVGRISDGAPGKFNVKAVWPTESKKAGLPPGASHVEYSWLVLPKDDRNETDLSVAVKDMTVPSDEFRSKISTKVRFVIDLKAENSGKWVIIFLRWYVDTNEALSSNYSIAYLRKIP